MMLDRFHDDDGIIHHEADGQDEPEKRERVDGKAKERKDHERADQRNRHGAQRDQGGAPALQEDEDDEDHQRQRFEQREDDFVACRR